MFFAEELPTSPIVAGNAITIVIVIWTVMAIAGFGLAIVAAVIALRRRPAIESEFATKRELKEGLERVDRDIKQLVPQIFTKLDHLESSVNHEFSSLNRAIGKLEGSQELAKQIGEAIKTR